MWAGGVVVSTVIDDGWMVGCLEANVKLTLEFGKILTVVSNGLGFQSIMW